MNFYHSKLNAIKVLLGMDVKMVDALLKDGVTRVSAESLEPGSKVFVVSESGEKAPAPEGIHELEDGTEIYVDAEGTITEVEAPEKEVEETKEEVKVEAQEVPAGEESAKQPTKSEKEVTKEEEMETEKDKAINEAMEKVMMAVEAVAKEIGSIKEEMASMKTKFEKMSKTPGSSKISTFNYDAEGSSDPIEDRLETLKSLRNEFKPKTRF